MTTPLKFRLARPEDKTIVSTLIVQALNDLAMKLINSKNADDLIPIIELFFIEKGNIYSFENTIVGEDENGIIGSITGYDGSKFKKLRKPFIDYMKSNHAFNSELASETAKGEFYIDTISVIPYRQGYGIGSLLINEMINYASKSGHKKVGLLVDKNNPKAKKLYLKLGFEPSGEKTLLGTKYEHLVFTVTE